MHRHLIDSGDDVGQVGIPGLAKGRRYTDVDRVDSGKLREVGGGGERQPVNHGAEVLRLHVRNVGVAPRDGLRPFRVDIKADGRQAGPGKLDREGQTDVAETDHACSCPFRPNPIEQRVSRHHVRRGQV